MEPAGGRRGVRGFFSRDILPSPLCSLHQAPRSLHVAPQRVAGKETTKQDLRDPSFLFAFVEAGLSFFSSRESVPASNKASIFDPSLAALAKKAPGRNPVYGRRRRRRRRKSIFSPSP